MALLSRTEEISYLPWDMTKISNLFIYDEKGIGFQLPVIIHLETPWFEDST
jgi:hypothetical protein